VLEEVEVRATTLDVAAPTADRSLRSIPPCRAVPSGASESCFRNQPAPEIMRSRIMPGAVAPRHDVDGCSVD